jgi:hypothetical protein
LIETRKKPQKETGLLAVKPETRWVWRKTEFYAGSPPALVLDDACGVTGTGLSDAGGIAPSTLTDES